MRLLKSAETAIDLPVQVIGELRQGAEHLMRRGDFPEVRLLKNRLNEVMRILESRILAFDAPSAEIRGRLMGPSDQNPMDKQIAAIALHCDLAMVTRNTVRFLDRGSAAQPIRGRWSCRGRIAGSELR